MLKSAAYYFLHEQAVLLSYCAEEGDIPQSPLWVPEFKKKKQKTIINTVDDKKINCYDN